MWPEAMGNAKLDLDMVWVARIFYGIAALFALLLLAILYTGGFTVHVLGQEIACNNIALFVILLLLLLLTGICFHHRFRFREVMNSHVVLVLFSISLMVYLANMKTLAVGDTLPQRYLPFSVLREGNFDFNEFPFLYKKETPYWMREVGGRYVSWYPIGASLISLPVFAVSAAGPVDVSGEFPEQLEKLAASIITALSVVILFLALQRIVERRTALLLAAVYAFATTSLSVSSQALWQHGPGQLCIAAALYCIIRGRSEPNWIPPAGAALALAVVCRPFDILIALPLCVYIFIHHFKQTAKFVLCGLPFVIFQLWYNLTYFQTIAISQADVAAGHNWSAPFAETLAGLLFSPGRGLFIYSCIFLFLIPALFKIWTHKEYALLRYASVGAGVTILAYAKWSFWTGGYSFGPRFFSDLNPVFVLLLTPLESMLRSSKITRAIFLVAFLLSFSAHLIGSYLDDRYWNVYVDDERHDRSWLFTDNQLVNPIRRIWTRCEVLLQGLPASDVSPQLLHAQYASNLPSKITCATAGMLRFDLTVTNTGKAVFLAWPPSSAGWTRLGWRWQKGGKDLARTRHFLRLRNDLLPDHKEEFQVALQTPDKPGEYTLVVELATQGTGWLSSLGNPPLQMDASIK